MARATRGLGELESEGATKAVAEAGFADAARRMAAASGGGSMEDELTSGGEKSSQEVVSLVCLLMLY